MRKGHFLKHVLLGLVIVAGFSAITMLLWNWLIPTIFSVAVINFWQALGLLALARLLFGGIGGHHWMGRGMMHHHKNPIREKWQKMTPEERMEFVQKYHHQHDFRKNFRHDFFHQHESEKQEQREESETK